MPETASRNYQSTVVMVQGGAAGPMDRFCPIVAGKTLGAHNDFIRKLKAIGQTEEPSPPHCDYYLAFCPIVSRVGTDINEAMEKIPDDKQMILVVMHHTMNPENFVGDSRRHVNRPDVILTVDCVFHEGRFQDCNRNKIAFNEVERLVGRHRFPAPLVEDVLNGRESVASDVLCHFHYSL
ncbi:uncharacterized protein LOC144542780 [Centroberyx gerrardi]